MPESTTSAELSSWAMPKEYAGGLEAVGSGKLNWRGRPACGNVGQAGINCYNVHSGSPQTEPRGGNGCRENLGRWSGNMHWYMADGGWDTYVYVCNGAQHSSTNRFSSRVWFRSPDSNEKW